VAAANNETNLPSSEENTTDDNDVEKETVCCAASSYPPGAGATEVSCSSLGTGIYVSGVVTDNNNSNNNNNCCASGGDHCCPADPENLNMLRNMADHIQNVDRANNNSDDIDDEEAKVIAALKEDAHQLMHMGAATALAIAIHNFPEGMQQCSKHDECTNDLG
jgi:zinc transporter ZupT